MGQINQTPRCKYWATHSFACSALLASLARMIKWLFCLGFLLFWTIVSCQNKLSFRVRLEGENGPPSLKRLLVSSIHPCFGRWLVSPRNHPSWCVGVSWVKEDKTAAENAKTSLPQLVTCLHYSHDCWKHTGSGLRDRPLSLTNFNNAKFYPNSILIYILLFF